MPSLSARLAFVGIWRDVYSWLSAGDRGKIVLAVGIDCTVEFVYNRVVVRKGGQLTADIPISDVSETRFRPASAFNDGHLQIRARDTVIDGMNGTAFFKAKSLEAFTLIKQAIDRQIVPEEDREATSSPKVKPPESMRVMLSSGAWIQISGVKLYPETHVSEIRTLRIHAAKTLGPSSALGVFGTPGLTLAAEAIALSLVSGFLANAAQKQAAEGLQKAQALYEKMIASNGVFVEISHIANIELPQPQLWRTKRDGDLYLHSDDDFVAVLTPQGQFLINWRDVSAIQFSSGVEAVARPS